MGLLGASSMFCSKDFKQVYWFLFYLSICLVLPFKVVFCTSETMFSNHWGIFMVDSQSVIMILLAVWVVFLSFLSMNLYSKSSNLLLLMIMVLLIIMVFLFSSGNIFFFFVFFELSLLPIFFIIKFFGTYKERVFSLYYFIFFTIISSIPFMLGVVYLIYGGVSDFIYLVLGDFQDKIVIGWLILVSVLLGFLSKLPVFGFHMWLPKAHVDAPVGGSMILAGVLLKLGGFGVYRLFTFVDYYCNSETLPWFLVVLGIFSYFFTAFICTRVLDMKVVVALSSVSHMSFAFSGLTLALYWGVKGGFLMFVSHGIVSPVLFYIVHLMTKLSSTRTLSSFKGLYSYSFSFMIFSVIFVLFNISFPPFINFFAEVGIMVGVFTYSWIIFLIVFLSFLFSSVYAFGVLGLVSFSKKKIVTAYVVEMLDYFIFFCSLLIFGYISLFVDFLI